MKVKEYYNNLSLPIQGIDVNGVVRIDSYTNANTFLS